MSPKAKMWLRATVDYGPLLAFLAVTGITGNAITASYVVIPASIIALAVGFLVEKRLAPMPLITAVLAIVFGGLTVMFHDERIIKMKPTVLYMGFAVFLMSGFARGKNPLKTLMGDTFHLPDAVVRTLTLRYALMFMALAVLNEIVWRTQPTRIWALYKFPGAAILIFIFALSQARLMLQHMPDDKAPKDETPDDETPKADPPT